jgi:hypothetical protein
LRFRGVIGPIPPVGEAVPHRDGESPFPDEQQVAPPQDDDNRRRRGNCVPRDQPRVIVAGDRTAALIAVVDKKLVFHDSEIFADSLRKLIMFYLKNSVSDMLQFVESIIAFHLNFDHLVTPK